MSIPVIGYFDIEATALNTTTIKKAKARNTFIHDKTHFYVPEEYPLQPGQKKLRVKVTKEDGTTEILKGRVKVQTPTQKKEIEEKLLNKGTLEGSPDTTYWVKRKTARLKKTEEHPVLHSIERTEKRSKLRQDDRIESLFSTVKGETPDFKALKVQNQADREKIIAYLTDPLIDKHPDVESILKEKMGTFLRRTFLDGSMEILQRYIDELGPHAHLDLDGLQLNDHDISRLNQLQNLHSLDLSNTNVKATALRALPASLKVLNLNGCKGIADSVFLRRLTHLETLHLNDTKLSDADLQNLPISLKELSLGGLKTLTDCTPLNRLKHLKKLDLTSTNISDLEPLPASIRVLNLSSCPFIIDFSHLSHFPLKKLDLFDTKISDGDFKGLQASLRSLDIRGCHRLADLSPLSGMVHLQQLSLEMTEENFRHLPVTLKELNIGCEQLASLQPLSRLTHLEHLQLRQAHIVDINLQSIPPSVKSLYFSFCFGSTDFKPLSHLRFLERFSINDAHLKDLNLLNLPLSIRELSLRFCKGIVHFDLSRFTQLERLDLAHTHLSNEDLEVLPKTIKELIIRSCRQLTDFSPLSDMTGLEKLDVSGTHIDSSAFRALPISLRQLYYNACPSLPDSPVLKRFTSLETFAAEGSDVYSALSYLPSSLRNLAIAEDYLTLAFKQDLKRRGVNLNAPAYSLLEIIH